MRMSQTSAPEVLSVQSPYLARDRAAERSELISKYLRKLITEGLHRLGGISVSNISTVLQTTAGRSSGTRVDVCSEDSFS